MTSNIVSNRTHRAIPTNTRVPPDDHDDEATDESTDPVVEAPIATRTRVP